MSEQPDTFASLKKRWCELSQSLIGGEPLTVRACAANRKACADELESLEQRARELRDKWLKMSTPGLSAWDNAKREDANALTALLGEEPER